MASGLPRYVSYRGHGATTVSAPVTISDSLFRCFAFKSDGNQVQQFLDQTLNRATPEIQYRVLGGYVFIVIAENGKVQSPDNIGWDPDNEVAAFIPVLEERPPLPLPEKLAMWVPYLLIDTSIGMIAGREIWGFNKSLMTKFDDAAGKLVVNTEVFAHLSQSQLGKNEPLLSITPWVQKSAFLSTAQSSTNLLNSAADLFSAISNNLPNWLVNSPALNLSGLGSLTLQPDIPLPIINLKEIRDAEHTRRAGLMQLVECYGQVNGNMSGGEIHSANNYTLTINQYESHQLVKDLGFLDTTPVTATSVSVKPEFAFWLYMDWIMPPGRIIYSSI